MKAAPHFQPRWLIGKVVAKVDMRPFDDGRGRTAHQPLITFTDGSRIAFLTEETEVDKYGVDVIYIPSKRRARTST